MAIRLFTAGERPSAADINTYFLQQHSVIKAIDESVTNSTTLQNDDELFAPVMANTDYWVWALIFYMGPASNGNLKINWNGPSGANFTWVSDSLGGAAASGVSTVSRNMQTIGSSPAPGTVGSDTTACIKGILRIAGTSGTFQLTWAQATASATACVIYSPSTLILRRLAS